MKNFTLIILATALSTICSIGYAQCPPGNITLGSQTEISNFIATYPDCTEIAGNLRIGGESFAQQSDISDISQLINIKTVLGDLRISYNSNNLSIFSGLSQLTYVGGSVYVFHNHILTDLSGLGKLKTVGGNIKISGNSLLTHLGLEELTTVGADMNISENPVLEDLSGFNKLTSIGGRLTIESNYVLSNVNDLYQLTSINGGLSVTSNTALTDLKGFRQLTHLSGDFNIALNNNLTELGDLKPMMSPSATLRVAYNNKLSDCVVQTICGHLSNGGPVEVIGNGAGCSNVAELEDACISTLPVRLTDFRTKVVDKSVVLTWNTETESNNEGFEIQRSKDAIDWKSIGWVKGKGNSSTLQKYSFTDEQPILGKSYYRLVQLDMNGKTEYSATRVVTYYGGTISIHPNPANDFLQLSVIDELPIDEVIVYDTSGREMLREVPSSYNLNVSELPSGTYMISITIEGDTIHKRLLIQ